VIGIETQVMETIYKSGVSRVFIDLNK